jgi:hypothetical protein
LNIWIESVTRLEAMLAQPNVFDAADFEGFVWQVAGQALGEMPAV